MASQVLKGAEPMLLQFTPGGWPQTIEVGREMHRWQIVKAGSAQQDVGQSTTAQQVLLSTQVRVCFLQS